MISSALVRPRALPERVVYHTRRGLPAVMGARSAMGAIAMTPGSGLLYGGIAGLVIGAIIGMATRTSPVMWAVGGAVVLGGYGALHSAGR